MESMTGPSHLRLLSGDRATPSRDRPADERDLVQRARSDKEAFGELFDRYHDAIFAYILHRTADVALAQDLTAETFLRALRNLDRYRWSGRPFSAWLFRIASNQCTDHYRRSRVRSALQIDRIAEPRAAATASPDFELLEAERRLHEHESFLALHRGIRRLPRRYQEVLVLRYFEHKSIAEVSEIFARPVGTIKSQIQRGTRLLHRLLAEDEARMNEEER